MRIYFFALLLFFFCLPTRAVDQSKQADDSWMQGYYQHPRPELFTAEVKKLQASGALQNEGAMAPAAAFFSRLFVAAEPPILAQWLEFIDQLPEADQRVFLVALRWTNTRDAQDALRKRASGKSKVAKYAQKLRDSKAPALDMISNPTPEELDMCWGAFFATGDPVYALPVIRCAAKPSKANEIDMSQGAARWSLKSLCASHKKLRAIKDDFYKTAKPAERKSLDELFNK